MDMTPLETKISAVTVFVQQARVTRQGKITLAAGEHLLSLNNLPNTLEEDSVRVSGRGAGATLLSVDVKKEFVAETPLESVEILKQRKQELEQKIELLKTEQSALQAHHEFNRVLNFRSGERLAHSLALGKVTLEQADALDDYLLAKSHQRLEKLSRVNQQIAQEAEKLELVRTQIRQSEGGQKSQTQIYQVRIAVRVENQIEAEFDIDYIVKGSSWTPFYDVRLLADQQIELTYFADVTQRSGEDWQNVNLALSTARPSKTATLPELRTWYLQHRGSNELRRMEMKQEMQSAAPAMAREQATLPPPPPIVSTPTTEYQPVRAESERAALNKASSGSLTYLIRTPTDSPSDGTPHKTTVAVLTMSAKLDYLTIPKIAPEAYLRATITNTSDYTLLPGTISIFHGEDFIGKTQLRLIAAKEDFKIQLGIEERIKVERKLVSREMSKRFMGSSRRIHYSYQIKVTNLLPDPAKITISDQLPVSQHENIVVQIGDLQPIPQEVTELNQITWSIEVAAGASENLQFGFMVDAARQIEIRGLEE